MIRSQAQQAHIAFINQQDVSLLKDFDLIDTMEFGKVTQQWLKDNYPETTVEEHSKRPWADDNADDSVTVYRFQDRSFIAFNKNGFYDIN